MKKTTDFGKKIYTLGNHLKSFALKLTHNEDDAYDLVQETFLKALKYEDKFIEGTNLKGWLFTIMKNSFINNYRRIVKRNTFMDATDNDYLLDSSSNYRTHNLAEKKFLRQDLEDAIDRLPDDLRITFELNAAGFKYHEIAERLEIPIGTVKTRIFIARRKLRVYLNSYAHMFEETAAS
jgi:RNA polymerase sigma-70 factor (ECF subfamily)